MLGSAEVAAQRYCRSRYSGAGRNLIMASEKQILANQQNSAKSTGPRTPEGKAISSKNALKLGLRTLALLPGEDQAAYEEMAEWYYSCFQPAGPVETSLVVELIHCDWWRRQRAPLAEMQVLANALQEIDGPSLSEPTQAAATGTDARVLASQL